MRSPMPSFAANAITSLKLDAITYVQYAPENTTGMTCPVSSAISFIACTIIAWFLWGQNCAG